VAGATLALGPVGVDDEAGRALETPLPDGPASPGTAGPGAVVDPLRTLFGPPPGGLGPGQEVDWILWGRAPGAGAHLVGLLPPPDSPEADDFERSTGLRGPLLLVPSTVRRSALVVPVARLDRAGGKIPAGAASEEDRGTADSEDR
jgi:hypothetical protein